jgi:acyl-CoA synthetase (NDP forming)
MVLNMLLEHRYPGPLYPINPKREELFGLRCYPSLASVPGRVDLIYVALPGEAAPAILLEAGQLGVGGAAIPGNGFADGGPAGEVLQKRLTDIANAHGIAICGPNNMGFINYHARVLAWPTYIPPIEEPGRVALISHSGSVGIAMTQDGRHLKLAYCISAGNEANVGVADYLVHCVDDDNVTVILMFLETIREPVRFAEAAIRARRNGKRIAVVKVGRSETASRMVSAHTGSLAGEDELYEAFFRRLGILRVPDLDTLAEAGALLSSAMPEPERAEVMLVMLSGGEGALAADLCSDYGIPLPNLNDETCEKLRPFFPAFATPRNPIDGYGLGWNAASFEQILKAVANQPDVGTLALCMDSATVGSADDGMVEEMAGMCARLAPRASKRIVYINNTSSAGINCQAREAFEAIGVPVLLGLHHGICALSAWLTASAGAQAEPPPRLAPDVEDSLGASLSESQRLAVLSEAGVSMVTTHEVHSAEDAVARWRQLDGPVVMKGTSTQLLHKTEHDLVALNLRDAEQVRAAFTRLSERLDATVGPQADQQVLLQPMVEQGVELIVGATLYPGFGMLVAVGLGGTLVEVIQSASVELAPITEQRALAMLDETPAGKLIRGVRRKGPYDLQAAIDAIVVFSQFAARSQSAFKAIEVNPLIVLPVGRGVVGVDAVFER